MTPTEEETLRSLTIKLPARISAETQRLLRQFEGRELLRGQRLNVSRYVDELVFTDLSSRLAGQAPLPQEAAR